MVIRSQIRLTYKNTEAFNTSYAVKQKLTTVLKHAILIYNII